MLQFNGLGYAVCSAVVLATFAVLPVQADLFEGTYTPLVHYDDNIGDGVVILQDNTTTLTITRNSPTQLTATLNDTTNSVTIPLTQTGQRATATGAPIAYGDWTLLEFAVVSDGINMAFLMVGKDASPLDIGFLVASWSQATEPIVPSNVEGTWSVNSYSDPNLRNMDDGFEWDAEDVSATLTVIGPDQVHLAAVPAEGQPLQADMLVSGNIINLINPPVAHSHLLQIATDGNTMAGCSIGVEINDPTDVSVSIMLGHRVPEPATLCLLAVGGAALLRRRRTA